MRDLFKNLPFFKWYFKNTRNKIIFLSSIFILVLVCYFLHRPLGLIIFWIDNHRGYTHSQLDELNKHITNKDIYIQLSDKYNLPIKVELHKKELLGYIDSFSTDLSAISLLGLKEWYYQSFLAKAYIYMREQGYYTTYKSHKDIPITKNDIESTLAFLDDFDKVVFFFDEISLENKEYKRYAIQANIMSFFPIQLQMYILINLDNTLCAVIDTPTKNILLKRLSYLDKSLSQDFDKFEVAIHKQKENVLNDITKIKEKLNECK